MIELDFVEPGLIGLEASELDTMEDAGFALLLNELGPLLGSVADPLPGATLKDGLGIPLDTEDDLDCDLVLVPGS